ncbi:MAG: hypothetical protein OQK75_10710 [Gammaproteobacteria bacterium]|nr:hypothetical protein [Gammaproteobacteria bacterium]MCW9030512.1 hypothetical protein [Gammaproteobacteria bacterium]
MKHYYRSLISICVLVGLTGCIPLAPELVKFGPRASDELAKSSMDTTIKGLTGDSVNKRKKSKDNSYSVPIIKH